MQVHARALEAQAIAHVLDIPLRRIDNLVLEGVAIVQACGESA